MKRLMALMLIAMFSLGTLSACNTTKGFGQDVEKVGEKIEDAATDSGGTDPRCGGVRATSDEEAGAWRASSFSAQEPPRLNALRVPAHRREPGLTFS